MTTEAISQDALNFWASKLSQEAKPSPFLEPRAEPSQDETFINNSVLSSGMMNENETAQAEILIIRQEAEQEQESRAISQEQTAILQTAQAEPKAELLFKQQESIKPSITEIERFCSFLNERFNYNLDLSNLIVLIHETKPNTLGFFRSVECANIWNTSEEQKPLNSIVLSSHNLRARGNDTPYETIAHEFAHYVNFIKGIKDASSNQYHNKHFKARAEEMLLSVEKGQRGFAYTGETDEFKQMVSEFKPSQDAFKIFQDNKPKASKGKSRLLLFVCSCGCKIRTARNENKPLNAVCQYCETEFQEVLK